MTTPEEPDMRILLAGVVGSTACENEDVQPGSKTGQLARIYALSDPRHPHAFRYVGRTTRTPSRRLSDHLRLATAQASSPGRHNTATANLRWIRDVMRDGYLPVITVLAEVPAELRKAAECQWIATLREAGHPLTNTTRGGEGPDSVSDETRSRHSESNRRRFETNPAEREFYSRLMIDRYSGVEGRAILSARATKQWSRPGAREAHSDRLRQACASPDVRQRKSDARLAFEASDRGVALRAEMSVRLAGEGNPAARLTWEQVREIRSRYVPRVVSQRRLAEEYGVTPSLIGQIIGRKIWTDDPDERSP